MERVSGTHLKPHIAVQIGDEKDATKKRNDCAKASVELECEVIELGKFKYTFLSFEERIRQKICSYTNAV